MAITQATIDRLSDWCRDSFELAAERRRARAEFFAEDDPRPVSYMSGAEESVGRDRRFLGYFLFDVTLPSGEKPVEVAIRRLYTGAEQAELLTTVAGTRFVTGFVRSVVGRKVYLALDDEQFEVRSPLWAGLLQREGLVAAHLVPVRHGYWLPGPGWVALPFTVGPGLQQHLKDFQFTPLDLERLLQSRESSPDAEPRPRPPEDDSLEEAVERMTSWALEHGHEGLVMDPAAWTSLVLKHMKSPAMMAFYEEVSERSGNHESMEEVNTVMGLASNIWNNVPQPDRGGKSAREQTAEFRTQ